MALQRLVNPDDFTKTYRQGKSRSHPLVAVHYIENGERYSRIGYVAGRKIGGAVRRNRAKRILREAMRGLEPRLRCGWDLVIVARPALGGRSEQEAEAALEKVLSAAELLERRA